MKKFLISLIVCLVPTLAHATGPTVQYTGKAYCEASNTPAVIKTAVLGNSAPGDHDVVSAVSGKKIRVLSFDLSMAGSGRLAFESGAGGTALSTRMFFAGNDTTHQNCFPGFCFETAAGAALSLEVGTSNGGARVTYIECE